MWYYIIINNEFYFIYINIRAIMKSNKNSNKYINLFLLLSAGLFHDIISMEYNKERNNSQNEQQSDECIESLRLKTILNQNYIDENDWRVIINFIIEGANINVKNNIGETALDIAKANNQHEIIELILAHELKSQSSSHKHDESNDIENSHDNLNILMDSLPEIQFYIMSKLVESQANYKEDDVNNYIVIKRILCNLFSTCKHFKQFDNKKDINYIITNISKLLKDKGSSNYQANTNKLKKILDKGYYFRPDFLEIKKLILSGSDVNIQNKNSFTALMIASCNDHKEIVKLLITAGADVNIQDKYNNAALIKALDNDYVDIAKLLIAAGTNINAINNRGSTALMWAVVRRHKEIVKLLIAAGADVNIQNESGNTALIEFIRFHDYNIEIAKLLIDAGADVNIKNTNGYTVLSLATVYNHSGMLELLREVTAK